VNFAIQEQTVTYDAVHLLGFSAKYHQKPFTNSQIVCSLLILAYFLRFLEIISTFSAHFSPH